MQIKNRIATFKKYFRLGINQRGMTIVEILVASVILLTVSLGLGAAFQSIAAYREKADIISTALTLESVITSGFADTDSIHPSGLKSDGTINPNAPSYRFDGSFGGGITFLTFNSSNNAGGTPADTYFRKDFSPCTVDFATDPLCVIKVALNLRVINASPTDPRYGYAFSIIFNPSIGAIAPLGGIDEATGLNVANFLPYHYSAIPNKHANICKGSSCSTASIPACNPASDLAAYAVDLINQTVQCLPRPINCPQPQASSDTVYIAKGINVTASMIPEMKCVGIRKAKCPDNFGLTRVVMSSLEDTNAAPTGTCEYATQNSGSGPVHTGGTIVGKVCPDGYISTSTCTMLGTGTNGLCPSGDTALFVPGQIVFTQSQESVDCKYYDPPAAAQLCGATWTGGAAQLTVSCVLPAAAATNVPATF